MSEPSDLQQPIFDPAGATISRVSTLELFFDLVFVFIVTQLTDVLAHPHGLEDYARAVLILAVTWWMYSGYAWLTSNVSTQRTTDRLLMFAGMGGFLMMALGIPQALQDQSIIFGIGYLLVALVHMGLFIHAPNSSARAIIGDAPFNLISASLIIASGSTASPLNWWLWSVALIVAIIVPNFFSQRRDLYHISPPHFVERNGLVVLVTLGESIVAVGAGIADTKVEFALVISALLGLALCASLWWSYFDQDALSAEDAMQRASGTARLRMAFDGYGYGHFVMIAGIMLLAAGLKLVFVHPLATGEVITAWSAAGGLGLYLLGNTGFRHVMGIGQNRWRLIGAALACLTVPIGLMLGNLAQLIALVVLMIGMIVLEQKTANTRID
jgi:low temperature requirement protein LtrA